MKVLVVDDEDLIPRLFQQRFRKDTGAGRLELSFAASGEEALTAVDQGPDPFDLILSDINMPGMSGLELVEHLIKRQYSAQLYIVSAYDSDEIRSASLGLGVQGFFPKPLDFRKLRQLFQLED